MWHASPRALAAALERAEGVRRIHVFDIAPRVMRGFYSACFATADGAIQRYLTPYFQPASLREGLRPFLAVVRRLGLATVDGRIEVGAGTGQRLHYFLPNVDQVRTEGERRQRRREGYRAWRAAAARARVGRLRWLPGEDGGGVACASGEADHYLFRLGRDPEEEPAGVAAALGLAGVEELVPGTALWGDIMGQWLP